MKSRDRLEHLERALLHLREAAQGGCVVVEGRKDVAALQGLGIGGIHRIINRGQPLQTTIDALVEEGVAAGWSRIVLLLDWDRTGGRLLRTLHDGLAGRVPVDIERRKELARVCHCKCVEDVPAEILALRRQTV